MAASPDPKKLQEVKKLLDDIAKGYDVLRQKNPFSKFDTKGIQDVDQTINQLQDALDGVNSRVEEFTESVSESYNAFKSIVSEIGNLNKGLQESKKAYSASASLAQKIRDHELGITNLSSKQLKQVKEKLESSKQNLKSATSLLQEERTRLLNGRKFNELGVEESKRYADLTKNIQDNIRNLSESAETYGKLNSQIDTAISKEKQLEKQLGVTGGVLKGIAKIPILGDLLDANEALEEMEDTLRKGGSSTEALSAGFKNIGSQIKGQLLNPANLVLGAITQLILALKSTDEGAGKMAKSMNMTYGDALNTRRELGNIAALSGDAALNTKNLQETMVAVGQSLGSNAKLNEKDLITFTKLREQAGYTNEQLAGIQKLSLVNGKSLEQNTKEILGGAKAYASRKGLVINEKQVLEDVTKASASLKLSLGGSADALTKSAVQARAVGLNLEQAATMADQLLNFESSIESELSAELLTGKDLNFEKARTLALNNDIAGAAEEIANQVGTSADFAKMNAIQQEAIAKSAGLTKDQLAQSLMDREALAKLSGVEGKDAKEKFDNLVKQVGMEEAKKRLGNEQLANQFQQQSVQERFNQTIEKLQEIFVQLAEPILAMISPIVDILSPALSVISGIVGTIASGFGSILKFLSPIIAGVGTFLAISKAILAVKEMTIAVTSAQARAEMLSKAKAVGGFMLDIGKYALKAGLAVASIPVVGPILAVGAIAAAIAGGMSLYNKFNKGDDIMSPGTGTSGYGSRTLFGPEGAIQLNNKDTVIAGTNLFDKADDMMSAPKGALQVSNKTAPAPPPPDTNAMLVAEMKRGNDQRAEQIKLQKKDTSVSTLRIQ